MNPFAEQFEQYLREARKSEKTIVAYMHALNEFITWYEQGTGNPFHPAEIGHAEIEDYLSWLQRSVIEDKKNNSKKNYAVSTINKRIAALKAFWAFVVEKEISVRDATQKIKKRKDPRSEVAPDWLEPKMVNRLVEVLEREKKEKNDNWMVIRDVAIIRLMLNCGLRVEEVALLKTYSYDKEMNRLVVQGKFGKTRYIPPHEHPQYLIDWLDVRSPDVGHDFMFYSKTGKPMDTRDIRNIVYKYGKTANIPNLHPHRLRHTFCKTMLDRGVPIHIVAQLAGHESMDTTRIYVKPSDKELRTAMSKAEY